ncbi:protein BUNDLE SHEATH DEFECTIVE 2, chloroplastic isoform X4 [Vigna angularis]|uniref:protein BUNDLE SHEATH DEFECTIVE 2, chloroplastic isoform X4 n=2 Tax=Vigna TaxID=3913 RepID=UPI0022B331B6|nr:protein BUNDLE SHEATH DEFECTIVE 2, chloroplastic isoform X4 [Vigna angularis]
MAHSLSFAPFSSFKASCRPVTGNLVAPKAFWINEACHNSKVRNFQSLKVKATDDNKQTKAKSIVCPDCEGNGAISCTQCKGTGVNSVDHFNGQFKAGGLCWLCRGKRDILCGSCNGAGFLGGFMSTFDD